MRKPQRILVADDCKDGADSLAAILRLYGHQVQTAYDGGSAVVAAATFRPDVAILDISMPGLDGYEVCRAIRAQRWGRNVLIIAHTAWGRDGDLARAMSAGFDMHMQKPLRLEVLLKQIESVRRPAPRSA